MLMLISNEGGKEIQVKLSKSEVNFVDHTRSYAKASGLARIQTRKRTKILTPGRR